MSSGRTLWFTGLPASGKSTLARALRERLGQAGVEAKIVDGDELRRSLCADLGYSRSDRRENIRRAAQVCRDLNDSGVIAVAALISPYREDREMARAVIGAEAFLEVHVAAPLSICEGRDPKGLYRLARAGRIAQFTGVSDPYEAPERPALRLETHEQSVPDCVATLLAILAKQA